MPQVAIPPFASLEHLTTSLDRERVGLYLSAFLAESRRRHVDNPQLVSLYSRAAEFVLQGGKRLRPRLCLASYRITSGRAEAPRSVWLAASSLELFHAFMLVHHDLIDGSQTRRDRPTLHEAIRLDGIDSNGWKHAADLGLISGDLLCALGMRLLHRSGLECGALGPANRLVADVLLETGLGEALDVLYESCPLESLNEAQILDGYFRKTGRDRVSGPLVLGATLASAPLCVQHALGRYGDLLGLG